MTAIGFYNPLQQHYLEDFCASLQQVCQGLMISVPPSGGNVETSLSFGPKVVSPRISLGVVLSFVVDGLRCRVALFSVLNSTDGSL